MFHYTALKCPRVSFPQPVLVLVKQHSTHECTKTILYLRICETKTNFRHYDALYTA